MKKPLKVLLATVGVLVLALFGVYAWAVMTSSAMLTYARNMTDTELEAPWTYLRSLPAVPTAE